MNAGEFNKKHKVGAMFIHHSNSLHGSRMVKTVDIACDFNCGAIVEINKAPYFVRINTLKPA
ncbi:hypothetical protein [Pectobacterium versatile]|uniref:hypothetical protein n=1 Tax=Pectobacterium versatile TaxID=2488639 RepID=UPI000C7EAEEF|nr:hypothetical protein F164LOC_17140 [Pectobacterium carotovorum]